MTLPTELIYLLAAACTGLLLYRYFSGRGGVVIERARFDGLPGEGQVLAHPHLVRWQVAGDDFFVAAWQIGGERFVVMEVRFDEDDEDEPALGRLGVSVDGTMVVSGIGWTEKIRDRSLRADVESVLKALAREATIARSDTTRSAAAKSVGGGRDQGEAGRR